MKYVIKNNATDYSIFLRNNCTEAEKYSAEELKKYVALVTKADIPIGVESKLHRKKIYIGRAEECDFAAGLEVSALNYDGFYIRTEGKNFRIVAANDRGVIFGTYAFIERFLGVKFFAPDCEYFSPLTEVPFTEIDAISAPDFSMRAYLNGYSFESGSYTKAIDRAFCAKMRYNDPFRNQPAKFGGKCNMYGRGEDHNFHLYVPMEKYYESHPEFYCYDKTYDVGGGNGWTIDLLSGITEDCGLDESMDVSVAKIVIEELKKDIVSHPDADFFTFEQEDGKHYYKHPEGTKKRAIQDKYGMSGVLIRFCNLLSRELNAWSKKELNGRTVNIVTFAYEYTKDAPIRLVGGKKQPIDQTVVADENVVVRIALGGNRLYSYFDERQFDWVKNSIEEWKLVANRFMFWAYDADFGRYFWYLPFMYRVQKDMRGFKDMGITYLLVQGLYDVKHHWLDMIKSYVYSKLLWDVSLSAEQLYDEYVNIYYGEAAPYVLKMCEILDKNYFEKAASDKDFIVRISEDVGYKLPKYYNSELLESALSAIEEGITAAGKVGGERGNTLSRRAEAVKLTPLYMKTYMYKELYAAATEEEHISLLKEFYLLAEKVGCARVSENYPLADFCDDFRKEIKEKYKN